MTIKSIVAGIVCAAFAVNAAAQNFPSKPVHILVGFGASGMIATWFSLPGPANMSPELVARIQRDTARMFNTPTTKDKLTGMGVDLVLNSPEQFRDYLRAEIARHTKVVKGVGIKVQ